jgi:tryptophan halogenase
MWEKNVIAIGLSSVFTEPLQATSIHITIVQLTLLTREILKKKKEFTIEEKGKYNSFMNRMCDDYVTFLQMHYLTKRNDTDFWKFCNHEMIKTERTKEIIKMCEEGCPIPQDFNMYFGYVGWGIYSYTLAGTGQISKSNSEQILSHFNEFDCESQIEKLSLNFKEVTKKYLSNTDLIRLLQNKGLNKNWGGPKNITVRI